ncbi:MAG: hypothetical protein JJ992_10005, partial [Planctomycetes bacterium]|nr:hypothetical protein [Planctomycetota bacterium]
MASDANASVMVFGLENETRTKPHEPIGFTVSAAPPGDGSGSGTPARSVRINYYALGFNDFVKLNRPENLKQPWLAGEIDGVIGTSSVQPCATAASFAASRGIPFWADVFGDPFSEIQSKAQLSPEDREANSTQYHHVWKLMLPVLLQGDRFSSLSERQRFALIGQLGVAGRLNRLTSGRDIVHAIPYGLYH